MKRRIVCYGFCWVGAVAALLILAYVWSVVGRHPSNRSYEMRVLQTLGDLDFARGTIDLFNEEMGRFPKSVDELNEYREKYRERSHSWKPFREGISTNPKREGHAELDGSGGFFYDPQSGDIRVNLTKPLHEYWRWYSGKRKDEIPANW